MLWRLGSLKHGAASSQQRDVCLLVCLQFIAACYLGLFVYGLRFVVCHRAEHTKLFTLYSRLVAVGSFLRLCYFGIPQTVYGVSFVPGNFHTFSSAWWGNLFAFIGLLCSGNLFMDGTFVLLVYYWASVCDDEGALPARVFTIVVSSIALGYLFIVRAPLPAVGCCILCRVYHATHAPSCCLWLLATPALCAQLVYFFIGSFIHELFAYSAVQMLVSLVLMGLYGWYARRLITMLRPSWASRARIVNSRGSGRRSVGSYDSAADGPFAAPNSNSMRHLDIANSRVWRISLVATVVLTCQAIRAGLLAYQSFLCLRAWDLPVGELKWGDGWWCVAWRASCKLACAALTALCAMQDHHRSLLHRL